MGNGYGKISGCFTGAKRQKQRQRHDIAVLISEPLDEGLGHSFCYIRPAEEEQENAHQNLGSLKLDIPREFNGDSQEQRRLINCESTTFKSISGASVSANTSTPLTTAPTEQYNSFSYYDRAAAFESSTSFSAIPLQPVPRGFSNSGPLTGSAGFLSGPLERGFLSGPLERGYLSGPLGSGPLDRGYKSGPMEPIEPALCSGPLGYGRKRFRRDSVSRALLRPLKRVISRTISKTAMLSVSHHRGSLVAPLKTPSPKGREREGCPWVGGESKSGDFCSLNLSSDLSLDDTASDSIESQNVQWAHGKAGEDRVHIVISEEAFNNILTLSNGAKIPQIGLGTWLSKPHEVENAVEIAVRNGYRHLDLAQIYQNQDEVGRALKKVVPSVVKREDLWITSKLWNSGHTEAEAVKELDLTLSQLDIDYLDLYLIHWPIAFGPGSNLFPKDANGKIIIDTETSLVDTWKTMIKLHKTGKVKNIGVSNFTVAHLKGIIEATGVKPLVNQVEAHPLLPQDDLVEYCKKEGIHITAYSPLGNNLQNRPKLTDHSTVKSIAEKLNATEAQVLIAWGAQRGQTVIPKSVQEERIISNFKQITLSDEDFAAVTAVGKGNHTRFNIPNGYTPSWHINLFDEPEEANAEYQVKTV